MKMSEWFKTEKITLGTTPDSPPTPPRFVKNSLQVVGQSFAIAWQTLRKAAENFEILKAGSDELLLIYR